MYIFYWWTRGPWVSSVSERGTQTMKGCETLTYMDRVILAMIFSLCLCLCRREGLTNLMHTIRWVFQMQVLMRHIINYFLQWYHFAFTSLVISQVVVSNANGLFSKTVNKPHIYFNFLMRLWSLFWSHQFFTVWELNLSLRAAENSLNVIQSGSTLFCFLSISWMKMIVHTFTSFRNDT